MQGLWGIIQQKIFRAQTLSFQRQIIVMAKSTRKKASKAGKKNSLVNNINARKEKGISRDKKHSTVSDAAYKRLEDNWDREMYS